MTEEQLNQAIIAYRAWLAVTPKVPKLTFGSSTQIVLSANPLWDAAQEALAGNYTATISNITNTETLDGFAAWYNQIYLPSQG